MKIYQEEWVTRLGRSSNWDEVQMVAKEILADDTGIENIHADQLVKALAKELADAIEVIFDA